MTSPKHSFYIFSFLFLVGCSSNNQDQSKKDTADAQVRSTSAKKVTGIGGVFFKCKDTEKMKNWYKENLGFQTDEYGTLFESRSADDPSRKEYLQWSPFSEKTKYFEPSEKEFMINYRVENLLTLKEELVKNGVVVLDSIESFDYGKFLHIMDPEGNKIELWEPVDSVFTKSEEGKSSL